MSKGVSDILCTYDNVGCAFDIGFSPEKCSHVQYDKVIVTNCQSGLC